MYFKKIASIYYQFNINNDLVLKIVKDITANVRFRKAILENITLFDEYDLKDGETPEILAARYYGNPEYHWIIMLCNQRYNWIKDFPMSTNALEEYISETYEDPYETHHWEKDNFIVDSTTLDSYPVSNYEYESQLNESKRRIKLISPILLDQIIRNMNSLV